MQSQPITNGIDAVMKFCDDFRTQETSKRYLLACESIKMIYNQHHQECYDPKLNEQIRNEVKLKIESNSTTKYSEERYAFRTLGMLDDYYAGNPFQDKYPVVSRFKYQLNPFYQDLAEEFKASLTVTKLTIPVLYSIARDFFYYLQQLDITDLTCIQQENLYDFLRLEYTNHQGCMNNVMYVLRLLCEFLRGKNFFNIPTELLPFALPPSRKKVLPSFERADMESILTKPDTQDPVGKRDYAILMLASVTGIRAIDIANLKLTDINWKEMTIYFIQHKTGFGLSLPLDAEAGAAVADYILNSRPAIDSPYVFLTAVMPFRKLNDKSSIANILNKYTRLAGINKEAYDGKSFHAFRRSMGIWLLDTDSSPEMISQILGHKSKDVLKRYLPLNTSKLNICAIGFDVIQVQSEVYR